MPKENIKSGNLWSEFFVDSFLVEANSNFVDCIFSNLLKAAFFNPLIYRIGICMSLHSLPIVA